MISREYLETCLERFNMGLQLIKDRLTLLTLGSFGAPERILTDRGTAFHNELVSELIHMCRAEHELTIAYSKEENAIVERANQEVIRHLRALLFDKRAYKKWSFEELPLVQDSNWSHSCWAYTQQFITIDEKVLHWTIYYAGSTILA